MSKLLDFSNVQNEKFCINLSFFQIVATVESSSISACSAGSMVSAGKFTELCIRFAEDFNHTLDDWKPTTNDPNIMNFCLVSEGSYEVCSQTAKAMKEENAKWFLNIQWKMTGTA